LTNRFWVLLTPMRSLQQRCFENLKLPAYDA
jgi:hypothetical protein